MVVAPECSFSHELAHYDYELIVYMDDILIASYENFARTELLFSLLSTIFREFGVCIN